jgi:hypothetical protein
MDDSDGKSHTLDYAGVPARRFGIFALLLSYFCVNVVIFGIISAARIYLFFEAAPFLGLEGTTVFDIVLVGPLLGVVSTIGCWGAYAMDKQRIAGQGLRAIFFPTILAGIIMGVIVQLILPDRSSVNIFGGVTRTGVLFLVDALLPFIAIRFFIKRKIVSAFPNS